MGREAPTFPWIGWVVPVGGITVTQVEILNDRISEISGKVDKLVSDFHQAHIQTATLVLSTTNIVEVLGEHKKILETLSDNMKFWRKLRQISYGIFAFIAAYAIGWLDFLKIHTK